MKGIYFHIPFCSQICYYCNFNKVFIQGQPVDDYLEALTDELTYYTDQGFTDFQTLYIGGGTPSALSVQQLDTLLSTIESKIPDQGQEFTIECNPNDLLNGEKLAVFNHHRITRISLGVQSFDDRVLRKINREHSADDAKNAIRQVQRAGFQNFSIDLIFRLPGQDLADFATTVKQALELDVPHCAAYSLILENRTVFYNLMRQGKLHLPSLDEEADMYELVIAELEKAGLHQYEISNFCRPGFESQHNLLYWHNDEYLGIGAGASGYWQGDRYQNFGPLKQYLDPIRQGKLPILNRHHETRQEQIEEQMFLGLRLNKGVDKQTFANRFGTTIETVYADTLPKLFQRHLLIETPTHYSLTEQGRMVGNDVFAEFLLN